MDLTNYQSILSSRSKNWQILERKLQQFKFTTPSFLSAINYLENLSQKHELPIYYFGGFLRDIYLGLEPRDIDIIFNKTSRYQFEDLVADKVMKRNRFGGYKLNIAGITVDAWIIQDTNYFGPWSSPSQDYPLDREAILPTIFNMPKTTFFNVESIVLEVYRTNDLDYNFEDSSCSLGFEHNFFNSCDKKVIEIQDYALFNQKPVTPFPQLQIIRTYNLQQKLSWRIGEKLKQFLKEHYFSGIGAELSNLYN